MESTSRRARHAGTVAVFAAVCLAGWIPVAALGEVGEGAAALLTVDVAAKLSLSDAQRRQIQSIMRATAQKTVEARTARENQGGLKEELARIRQGGQDQAVALLTPEQKAIWVRLAGIEPTANRAAKAGNPLPEAASDIAARSLIIPSIQELRNPPSRDAFGPNASVLRTQPHPTLGEAYVLLTDHTDPRAIAALGRLAEFRHGTIVNTPSLGELHQNPAEFARLQQEMRRIAPRFVAIAPRGESYRENMHLCMLRLLSSLDDTPGLDVFPGYLIAGDPSQVGDLVDRTIAFKPIRPDQIKPASIGTIEDDGQTRYRSYQKAKVLQKMFAQQGVESPALFVVTNPALAARADFPKLGSGADEIAMMPATPQRTVFTGLSEPAAQALRGRNVLFMFGHGLPDHLCGVKVSAFAPVDFSDELVFCGSCMSASPTRADRADLAKHATEKRFGMQAIENGAVMFLGHMGLCGGFPEVYPMAEHVIAGMSVGEAYQRVMNALTGNGALPDYYPSPAPRQANQRDPANTLLLILWADPALNPFKRD